MGLLSTKFLIYWTLFMAFSLKYTPDLGYFISQILMCTQADYFLFLVFVISSVLNSLFLSPYISFYLDIMVGKEDLLEFEFILLSLFYFSYILDFFLFQVFYSYILSILFLNRASFLIDRVSNIFDDIFTPFEKYVFTGSIVSVLINVIFYIQ